MRSGGLLVAMCAAACGSVEGAWIEVQGTDSTTRFEVFIASEDAACEKCDLQPAGVPTMLQGSRYTRDPDPLLELTASASHEGSFRFHAGETAKVHAIVIVGYDTANTITGAALVEHLEIEEPHRYLATLTPVTGEPLGSTPPSAGPQRAQVWGSEEARGKCAGLERWHDSELGNRTFIVPSDDPDCDGVVGPLECDPLAYLSSTSSADGPINCVATAPVHGLTVCRLGSASCVDGQAGRGPCEPHGACVPSAWCALTLPCEPGNERECLLAKLQMHRASARIECSIPFVLDGSTNDVHTCDNVPATTTIRELDELFPLGAAACTNVGVLAPSTSTLTFTSPLDVNGGTLAVQLDQAPSCAIRVLWTGGFLLSSQEIVAGLKITTDGAHDVILPMWITPHLDCSAPPSCHLELAQDPITGCTKPL